MTDEEKECVDIYELMISDQLNPLIQAPKNALQAIAILRLLDKASKKICEWWNLDKNECLKESE